MAGAAKEPLPNPQPHVTPAEAGAQDVWRLLPTQAGAHCNPWVPSFDGMTPEKGTKNQIPGVRDQNPDTLDGNPDILIPIPDTLDGNPDTLDQNPDTKNQKKDIRNQNPDILDRIPDIIFSKIGSKLLRLEAKKSPGALKIPDSLADDSVGVKTPHEETINE